MKFTFLKNLKELSPTLVNYEQNKPLFKLWSCNFCNRCYSFVSRFFLRNGYIFLTHSISRINRFIRNIPTKMLMKVHMLNNSPSHKPIEACLHIEVFFNYGSCTRPPPKRKTILGYNFGSPRSILHSGVAGFSGCSFLWLFYDCCL